MEGNKPQKFLKGQPTWRYIREPISGRLLARLDPVRGVLELKAHGVTTFVDLWQYWPELHERLTE